MGQNSNIEWTDATYNPWQGCLKVSPGCKQCYMYRDKARYGQDPKTVVRSSPATFNAPLKWVEPKKVFTCSWSDFFIEQADAWRDDAWNIIRRTPHLTYQILTKRPENIRDRLPDDWGNGWANVWLGVSVESKRYLWRLEALDPIPAVIKFVSYEPALEYVDFTAYTPILDWLISGGESGYSPRPASLDWFRQVRDDCQKWGVRYFHKQHGGSRKIDGVWGGRVLDGRTWDEMPKSRGDSPMTTVEKCPVCQNPAMTVRHGVTDPQGRFVHIEHCPECGDHYPIVCYDCRKCKGGDDAGQAVARGRELGLLEVGE